MDSSPSDGPAGNGGPTPTVDSGTSTKTDADQPEAKEVPAKVGDFSFTNQNGETITNKDLLGKEWVASFIFTKCAGPCFGLTERVMRLQNATKETDVNFVSFTVDPERDTPEQLATYAEGFGAEPGRWHFLTGEQAKIYRLILDSFKVAVKEDTRDKKLAGFEFAHSTRLMHVNKEGIIVGTYKGEIDAEVSMLRRVLLGKAETPKQNQFKIYAPTHPAVNATLNGLATILLIVGFVLIKQQKRDAHKAVMLSAFAVSGLFLACYLTYHFGKHYYTG